MQIDQLVAMYGVIPVTDRIGRGAYSLLKRYARSYGLPAFDSLIAATALEERCRLATRNRKYFAMIDGLVVDSPEY